MYFVKFILWVCFIIDEEAKRTKTYLLQRTWSVPSWSCAKRTKNKLHGLVNWEELDQWFDLLVRIWICLFMEKWGCGNLWHPKVGAPEHSSYDSLLFSIERMLINLGFVSLAWLPWHLLIEKIIVFDLAGNGLEWKRIAKGHSNLTVILTRHVLKFNSKFHKYYMSI